MQVPEKLALIGGSILLSSTLIFTLKSQASQILPKINDTSSKIFDHIGDAQKASDFDNNFKVAQKKGWQTGHWGSASFYVDNQQNMHVGSGQLDGSYSSLVNPDKVKTINLDKAVKAPSNSASVFSKGFDENSTLQAINGMDNLDTSESYRMDNWFNRDDGLKSLDVSHFNTYHVWNMANLFDGVSSVHELDLSSFDTSNTSDTFASLVNNNFTTIKMGQHSMHNDSALVGTYKNNSTNRVLNANQLQDGNAHPGTWSKQ